MLTISGTRFAESGNAITIGGSACAISSQSATQVVCTLPQHAGGVFDVQLLSPSAGLATPKQFTYSVGIVDVQPRAGSLYGGTLVTITLGKRLVELNYQVLQREADFRYSLVRVREVSRVP